MSSRFRGGAEGSFARELGDFAGGLSKSPPALKASSILCFEYAKPSAYCRDALSVSASHLLGGRQLTFTMTSASGARPFRADIKTREASSTRLFILRRAFTKPMENRNEVPSRRGEYFILRGKRHIRSVCFQAQRGPAPSDSLRRRHRTIVSQTSVAY